MNTLQIVDNLMMKEIDYFRIQKVMVDSIQIG